MPVISTAGHVDHGKSTLVLALTGTDTDRFAEEKERGLTIDLGFASLQLPSGRQVSFVDVPGHERFLKNMLAGVGGVAACLFVVAATEGWKPQSQEHLRILDLLGTRHGVVALTKAAIADEESREIARLDIEQHVAGTFLEQAPVIAVDSLTGQGLPELVASLDELLAHTPPAPDRQRPRLWIDRSFTIKGAGAVVTGTLLGGELAVEDKLALVSRQADASHAELRVRDIQNHSQSQPTASPGSRVALNLSGLSATDMQRGDALVRPGQWRQTEVFDASLTVLDSLGYDVSRRGAYVAYIGSGEFPVKLRVLGSDVLVPGETGAVRLFLAQQLPLLPGDGFVLREFGRAETAGGGQVLDIAPMQPAAKAQPLCLLAGTTELDAAANTQRIVQERGWVKADELELLVGGEALAAATDWQLGEWLVWPPALAAVRSELSQQLQTGQLDWAGLDERQRAALEGMDEVEVSGGLVRLAGQGADLAQHPYLQALAAEPFRPPPPPPEITRTELRSLLQSQLMHEASGVYFASQSVVAAIEAVEELLASQPEGFTVAVIRERLDTTRKYILPLLEILDRAGITKRQDDVRILGPRHAEAKAQFQPS